ncbi:MAG: DUF190 domain-containing protein [Cyanobacteria bacterium REEB67]|nr:DUF190 domain-containing protein [Cyanobacteria bacterium REEB67]
MITSEPMQRIMIFVDETDRYQGTNLTSAILEKLRSEGISGGTVLRGSAGFGSHGMIHTTAILDIAVALPEIIMAVDSESKIQTVLPHVQAMLSDGLIVVDQVEAIKVTCDKGQPKLDKKQQEAAQATTKAMQVEAESHQVSEYMDKNPMKVGPDTPVAEVIAQMIANGRSLLPVVSDQNLLLGVVQSEDILSRLLSVKPGGFHFFGLVNNEQKQFSQDIKSQTASQVMRTAPPVVQEETSMFKATQLMLTQKIKALPVVHGQTLVGVLRLPDVLKIALEIKI